MTTTAVNDDGPEAGARAARRARPGRVDASVERAARELIEMRGIRGTSLAEIADRAGVSRVDVAQRFLSVRKLAVDLFQDLFDEVTERSARELDRSSPLAQRLTDLFATELTYLEPYKKVVSRLLLDSLNPLSPSAALQAALAFRYGAFVRQAISDARARGEVGVWVSPAIAASAFLALRAGLVFAWLSDSSTGAERTRSRAERAIGDFARSLSPWLRGRNARSPAPRTSAPYERRAGDTLAEEETREREAPKRESARAPRTMLLEGEAQSRPAGVFVIENTLDRTITTSVSYTEFLAANGASFAPTLAFAPPQVTLDPGHQVMVQVSAEISAEMLVDEVYRGELTVASLPGTSVPIALRRQGVVERDSSNASHEAAVAQPPRGRGTSRPRSSSNKKHRRR